MSYTPNTVQNYFSLEKCEKIYKQENPEENNLRGKSTIYNQNPKPIWILDQTLLELSSESVNPKS